MSLGCRPCKSFVLIFSSKTIVDRMRYQVDDNSSFRDSKYKSPTNDYPDYPDYPMMALRVGFFSVYLAITIYIVCFLFWLERIDCKCSEDWRRDYIKVFLICSLVFPFISYALLRLQLVWLIVGVGIIQLLSMIFYMVTVFEYIHILKHRGCACSDVSARKVMEGLNVLSIVVIAGVAVMWVVMTCTYVEGNQRL
jgi:hypothetical protein